MSSAHHDETSSLRIKVPLLKSAVSITPHMNLQASPHAEKTSQALLALGERNRKLSQGSLLGPDHLGRVEKK